MVDRIKIALKILPYIAAVIFGGMFVAAMDVSSTLASMQDSALFNDQGDVIVNWFESKACMVLPFGYVSNCVYIGGITVIVVLSVLLAVVLVMLMILRRHEKKH